MRGNLPVRKDCDCQHQGGRELGYGGMANTGEPLINVVIDNKPKMVQPLWVVDNSSSFPNRLTDTLEALYSTYSEGKGPLPAHFKSRECS